MSAAALLTHAPRRSDLRRIGPLVALVVAAHGVLLAVPRQPPVASGVPLPHAQAVQFRVVDATPRSTPQRRQPIAGSSDAAAKAALPPPAALPPVVEPAPRAADPDTAVATAAPVLPPAQTWLGVALPGVATEDDQFFPRTLLSVAPAPLAPVLIDYPAFQGDAGRYVSELSLFIDETGAVVKVRVEDGDALPPPLQAAARNAFLNARFRPGEVADLGAVKSRIRIEVTFDSRDAAARGG